MVTSSVMRPCTVITLICILQCTCFIGYGAAMTRMQVDQNNKETFLNYLLHSFDVGYVKELKYAFASEAQWEVFLHVHSFESIKNQFNNKVVREEAVVYQKKLPNRKTKDGNIDFRIRDFIDNKIAIEVKVETKKNDMEAFSSKTLKDALRSDINSLRLLKKNPAYEHKWAIAVIGSQGQWNEVLNVFRTQPFHDPCWVVKFAPLNEFAVVLFDADAPPPPRSKSRFCQTQEDIMQPRELIEKDPNDLLDGTQQDFKIENILSGLTSMEYAEKFNLAIQQGKSWEVYAQVLISKLFQGSFGVGYREKN